MILCSKRVYLNVLTQLWSRDLLINANYFILDQPNLRNHRGNTHIHYNDENKIVVENATTRAGSKYNIEYVGANVLDPQVYVSTLLTNEGVTAEERVYSHVMNELNKDNTKSEIYEALFTKPLSGNQIQICIYMNDATIIEFGNLICEYLAYNFGCDIIFLDAMCRDNVAGQGYYQGNKQNGLYLSNYIRDYNLIEDFRTHITVAGGRLATTTNLSVWLNKLKWESLSKLYSMLFPDEPLKPGNYTEEMLRDIIIGKCTQGMPGTNINKESNLGNLIYSTRDLFMDVLDEYDNDTDNDFGLGSSLDLESWFS